VLIPIDRIEPNPDNPRHADRDTALAELAGSIAERGLLQPLVVRRATGRPGHYVVIAGSRRLLAARRVHGEPDQAARERVAQLPCLIKEASDRDAFADALLENLARADLSRAEMMEALLRLHGEYGWSASYIARRTGRNQSDISQLLGVARHPDLARLVRQEVIKPTVAGEINRLPEPVREATIAEVKAGTVRTVADVKRRRPAAPPEEGSEKILPVSKQVVISLPSGALPASGPGPAADHTTREATDTVLAPPLRTAATPATATGLAERLDGIRALAAMVDAGSAGGQVVLAAVDRDLRAAYERLAAYLARRDRREG
jgi:ParB family chromosome partitioning protein